MTISGPLALPLDAYLVISNRLTHGSNTLPHPEFTSFCQRYRQAFNDPLIRLLCCALCITFLLASIGYASWLESIGILSSVFVATFVSTLSEHCNEASFLALQIKQQDKASCYVSRQSNAAITTIHYDNDDNWLHHDSIRINPLTITQNAPKQFELSSTSSSSSLASSLLSQCCCLKRLFESKRYQSSSSTGSDISSLGVVNFDPHYTSASDQLELSTFVSSAIPHSLSSLTTTTQTITNNRHDHTGDETQSDDDDDDDDRGSLLSSSSPLFSKSSSSVLTSEHHHDISFSSLVNPNDQSHHGAQFPKKRTSQLTSSSSPATPRLVTLNIGDIVVGDLILLQCGDQIVADGYLISGHITVNQASLTGEDIGICKEPLPSDFMDTIKRQMPTNSSTSSSTASAQYFAQQLQILQDMYPLHLETPQCVFKGSMVEEGSGMLLVTAVGIHSMTGKTIADSRNASSSSSSHHSTTSNQPTTGGRPISKLHARDLCSSPLQEKLASFADMISFWAYVGSIIIALIYIFQAVVMRWKYDPQAIFLYVTEHPMSFFKDIIHAVFVSLIMIVVSVPEGLPTTITLVLSLNMRRLLQQKVLVRRLLGISTSGHVTKLFVDKTGTLSTGTMTVEMCFTIAQSQTPQQPHFDENTDKLDRSSNQPTFLSSSKSLPTSASSDPSMSHIFPHISQLSSFSSTPSSEWSPLQVLTYFCLIHSHGNAALRFPDSPISSDSSPTSSSQLNLDTTRISINTSDTATTPTTATTISTAAAARAASAKLQKCDLSSLVLDDVTEDMCIGGNSTDRALLNFIQTVKTCYSSSSSSPSSSSILSSTQSSPTHALTSSHFEHFAHHSELLDTVVFSSSDKFGQSTIALSQQVLDVCMGVVPFSQALFPSPITSTLNSPQLSSHESRQPHPFPPSSLEQYPPFTEPSSSIQPIASIASHLPPSEATLPSSASLPTQPPSLSPSLDPFSLLIAPQPSPHASANTASMLSSPSRTSSSSPSPPMGSSLFATPRKQTGQLTHPGSPSIHVSSAEHDFTPLNGSTNPISPARASELSAASAPASFLGFPRNVPVSHSVVIVKGAVELIIDCCSHIYSTAPSQSSNSSVLTRVELSQTAIAQTLATIRRISGFGYRIIALATYRSPTSIVQPSSSQKPLRAADLPRNMTLVAIFAISDQLRNSTPLAIAIAQRAGIDTTIISGDRAETCLQIARASHIVSGPVSDICNMETYLPRPLPQQLALGYAWLYGYNTPAQLTKDETGSKNVSAGACGGGSATTTTFPPVAFHISFLPVIIHAIALQYRYIALTSFHVSQLSLLDLFLLLPRLIIVARSTPEDKLKIILACKLGKAILTQQLDGLHSHSNEDGSIHLATKLQSTALKYASAANRHLNANGLFTVQTLKGYAINGNQRYRFDLLPDHTIIMRFHKGKYLPYYQCNYSNVIKLLCHRLYDMSSFVHDSLVQTSSSSLSSSSSSTVKSLSASASSPTATTAVQAIRIYTPQKCQNIPHMAFSSVDTMICGYVGDGANDVSSLTFSDAAFALGNGAETARDASDIILLRNSLLCIVSAIWYGRSLFHNVRLFVLFQITVNISICTLMLVGPFIHLEFPLQLTQLLWLNVVMDCLAAIALSSELPDLRLMAKKPLHPKCGIMNGKMLRSFICNAIYICCLSLFFLSSSHVHAFFGDQIDIVVQKQQQQQQQQMFLPTTTTTITTPISQFQPQLQQQQLFDLPPPPSEAISQEMTPTDPPISTPFLTGFFSFFILTCSFHIFNVRTDHVNIFHHILRNPLFLTIVPCILVLQIIFTEVSTLQHILQTVPLSKEEWLFVTCFAATIVPFDMLRKFITILYHRYYCPTTSSPPSSSISTRDMTEQHTFANLDSQSSISSANILSVIASLNEKDADDYLQKLHDQRNALLDQLFSSEDVNSTWIDDCDDEIIEENSSEHDTTQFTKLLDENDDSITAI